MAEKAECSSDIQPCELAIRLEERIRTQNTAVEGLSGWVSRLDKQVQDLSLDTAKEITALKTKLLFVSALGALAGSSLGAIVAGLVVFKITRG